ncbi:MAG TPA: DeoR/GlpR family DNA-binding transcription regulator [Beijerinckiaceae bacterium]|nr:DeoR/GlpR family DNA-binding transcription regulator [Beijerinckiaceae bacterium]
MSGSERLKKAARQRLIVAELGASATVRTSTLAQRLGVSAETVRRDIEELTRQGLVSRTYGGAAGRHVGLQPMVSDRSTQAIEERRRIARAAAALVQPGDVVMIDSGSTTAHLAQALAESAERITVITNGYGVANALVDQPAIRVILCPGDFSARERGVYGPETIAFLSRFNADAAFIGASGVTLEGPTDAETQACWVKRTMLSRTDRCVLLADSGKLDRPYLELVCAWDELTDFVTDREPGQTLRERVAGQGVRLHLPG